MKKKRLADAREKGGMSGGEDLSKVEKILNSDTFGLVKKLGDGVPRRFLNWDGYPFVIGLVMVFATSFDLYRSLSIYFADPGFFMWVEQGLVARFLIPRAWYLFVAWEWFLVAFAVYLSSRRSILVRVWGFVIAISSVMAPLAWYSMYFFWLAALAGWMAIPVARTLTERLSGGVGEDRGDQR